MLLGLASGVADAQGMAELFGKVASTVVVVRAKGLGAMAGDGLTRFSEVGSGVVISSDGKVMTAAHLVHGAEGIGVQFLGGRTVSARVVASELAADLCLIQLDQVPPGLGVAKLANSDTVRVGEQVIVGGCTIRVGTCPQCGLD
jgi:serine protease Do